MRLNVLSLLLFVSVFSLSHLHAQEAKGHGESGSFYQHRLAVFSGFALISGAVDENGNSVPRALPVVGLDYEYFFNPKFGLGLFNDLEIANYVIPFEDNDVLTSDVLRREYAVVSCVVALYEPWLGITFFGGPGYEFETHKGFPVLKLGGEFSKSFDGGWSAGFALSADLKEVNSAISLGLTIVKGIGKPK